MTHGGPTGARWQIVLPLLLSDPRPPGRAGRPPVSTSAPCSAPAPCPAPFFGCSSPVSDGRTGRRSSAATGPPTSASSSGSRTAPWRKIPVASLEDFERRAGIDLSECFAEHAEWSGAATLRAGLEGGAAVRLAARLPPDRDVPGGESPRTTKGSCSWG